MVNSGSSYRRIIVYSGDLTKVQQDALTKAAHVRQQTDSLSVYERLTGITVKHGSLLGRQPGDANPIPANKLTEILKTNVGGQGVIIEDFTRLISAADPQGIKSQLEFLLRSLPGMFSIRQHNTILGIGAVGLCHLARIEAAQRQNRSSRAKKAAASKDPDESKAASQKANAAKTALAQRKALKLRQQIDKIRDSLPDNDRSNLAAIARHLNEAGTSTPSGKGRWQTITVSRVLKAAAKHDRQREELRQKQEARKQRLLETTNRTPPGV